MGFEVVFVSLLSFTLGASILQYHYSNTAEGLTAKGYRRLRGRDFERALKNFDKAIEKNPKFVLAYQGRATTFLQIEDEDAALADCQQVLALDPSKLDEIVPTRALAYSKLGKAGEAISDFTRIIEKNPRNVVAYEKRASAYQKINRKEEALADLNYVIDELGEKSFSLYSRRGVLHLELKNYDSASNDFNAVVQHDIPDDLRNNTYTLLGITYHHLKRHEEALIIANRLIEIAPDRDEGYFQRGQVLLDTSDNAKALADFQQALTINPDNLAYYEPIAKCYLNLQQYSEALEAINQFIPYHPHHAPGYRIRGLVYMRLKQPKEALEDFTRYLETFPNNAEINNNSAWLKSAFGYYDEALQHINKAMERESDSAVLFDTRGQVYWLMGDYEAALKDYEQVQTLNDSFVGFMVGKAVVLYSLERTNEAIEIWKQIQTRDDELTSADALQKEFGFAPPFYEAMQQVETLAKS